MFAALGAAVTTGAFAAPLVYDYKASVKHMYAKRITVRDVNDVAREVYQKYIQSAKLKGYLVLDSDGSTSRTISLDRGDAFASNPPTCSLDHGRNRAFLVVQNTSAKAPQGVNARAFRTARILPANLDVKLYDDVKKFDGNGFPNGKTGLAAGYLYVGGEFVAPIRPKLDLLTAGVTERAAMPAPAAGAAGMAMIQDYLWQSYGLFGQYNSADFEGRNRTSWWQSAEFSIDGAFEGVNTVAWTDSDIVPDGDIDYYFHDTWMNGSGFGKFVRDSIAADCCGFATERNPVVLSTLSGSLKGGLFLCTYQGLLHNEGVAAWLNGVINWEDQWFCNAITLGAIGFGNINEADQLQWDLWQDGGLELNTTDVITGTWSIKLRTKNVPVEAPTVAEISVLTGNIVPPGALAYTEDATGLTDLVSTLKGCALQLNNQTLFVATTGDAETPERVSKAATRWSVPALSPTFATYYGLANFK